MYTADQLFDFVNNLELSINEQKVDFWDTFQYLSQMVSRDTEDGRTIALILLNTQK